MRLLGRNRGEILQEISQGMPAIQIVERDCTGTRACPASGPAKADPDEAKRFAHDLGIHADGARFHVRTLLHEPTSHPLQPTLNLPRRSP